jgi:hypothetical protein
MTSALSRRLRALEVPPDINGKPLPMVVPDDTSADELERLRRAGLEVYRLSDAVEVFL